MQSSSVVKWPSGLRYARRRMNYFISLEEHTESSKCMITLLVAYIFLCRYHFLLYNPILPIISLMRQYYKFNIILWLIDGIFSIIISLIWFYFIRRAIAYFNYRLPLLIRPYILPIVCLCTALISVYKILFGLVLPILSKLFNDMFH